MAVDIHLIDHTGRTSIIDSRDLDGRKYQLSDGRRQANLQMTTSIEQRHWKKSLTILPPKAIQVFPLVKAKPQMLMKPKLRSSSCLWPEALIGTSTVDGLSECCKSVATTGSTCCLGSCSNSIVLVDSSLLQHTDIENDRDGEMSRNKLCLKNGQEQQQKKIFRAKARLICRTQNLNCH